MISVSPFANAVCYIDKTINTAVSTTPESYTFSITNVTLSNEWEFLDANGEQVKLTSLDQLGVRYIKGTSQFQNPAHPAILTVTETGTLKVTFETGLSQADWLFCYITFGDVVLELNNNV